MQGEKAEKGSLTFVIDIQKKNPLSNVPHLNKIERTGTSMFRYLVFFVTMYDI